MKVQDLTRDQLVQVKQNWLVWLANEGLIEDPSWDDLANADSIVSDDEIFAECEGVEFVPDDFACSTEN